MTPRMMTRRDMLKAGTRAGIAATVAMTPMIALAAIRAKRDHAAIRRAVADYWRAKPEHVAAMTGDDHSDDTINAATEKFHDVEEALIAAIVAMHGGNPDGAMRRLNEPCAAIVGDFLYLASPDSEDIDEWRLGFMGQDTGIDRTHLTVIPLSRIASLDATKGGAR